MSLSYQPGPVLRVRQERAANVFSKRRIAIGRHAGRPLRAGFVETDAGQFVDPDLESMPIGRLAYVTV